MTIASPGICSCFTAANFSGLLSWLFRFRSADEEVAHQRAAVRAMHAAGSVKLELVAVAAQAVVLWSPALDRRRTRCTDAALRAVIGEADDVFSRGLGRRLSRGLRIGLRVFHS